MKKIIPAILLALPLATVASAQSSSNLPPPPAYYMPPPVVQAQSAAAGTGQVYVYDQKPMGGMPELIPAQEAQNIVDEFRTNYPKLGSPRMMIYVNRELVDQKSGLKLAQRTEKIVTSDKAGQTNGAGSETVVKNKYYSAGASSSTVLDRQTMRTVERLMGRPLRSAGVSLTDQRVASQLGGSLTADALTTDTEDARKTREAANKFADVVVEVLISSNSVTVPGISGDKTLMVPNIQMTAIRLKDDKIIGQAAASDVIAKAGGPAVAQNFDVDAITETTTLALMDDIMQATK